MMKRFAVGEPISGWPVETWNGLVDSKVDLDALTEMLRGTMSSAPQSNHANTVLIVNKTGAAVNEFDVLGIDDSAMTPPDSTTADEVILRGVTLEGIEPDIDKHRNAFAITLQPIADDAAGYAVLTGTTWARVNISDADHTSAVMIDATVANLASAGSGGVPILCKPTGTGIKWCVVCIGGASGTAKHLSCVVDESGHVSSADESFAVKDVVAMDGTFEDTTIDDVDNTLYDNHHFHESPLELVWNQDEEWWQVSYDGSAKNILADASEDETEGGSFGVDGFVGIDGFCPSGVSGTAVNPFEVNVDNDKAVWLIVKHDGTYQCIQATCPA